MDDQPLSNRIINHLPNGLSAAIQMDDKPVKIGLSTTIQMDYQPKSKWMLNLYQIGLSTNIQMDYQQLSKWIINYYPNG